MSLRELNIKSAYSSSGDNLLSEFYNPVLEQAVCYDRITAFFSPRVIAAASRGFSRFVRNGAKIRMLTSVELGEDVVEQVKKTQDPNIISSILIDKITESQDEFEKEYLSVFSYLLSTGRLELRVACVEANSAILHDKIGILRDSDGDEMSFFGSNNETEYGWKHNIESFMVFRSWIPEQSAFLSFCKSEFQSLWDGTNDRAIVLPISEAVKEQIIRTYPPSRPPEGGDCPPKGGDGTGIKIRDYQKEAIEAWSSHDFRGIYEMATGTGKTWTALFALDKLIKERGCKFITIVAPLKHLIEQWKEDIVKIFPNARIIVVNSDYPDWRMKLPAAIRSYAYGYSADETTIVMTTYASFSGEDYKKIMSLYPNVESCLVADEVHNARTDNILSSIDFFKYRLGLSATPKNEFIDNDDPQNKINRMIELFGGIVYRYPLEKAIGKDLVRYEYFPIFLYLNEEEMEEYERLSRQISYRYNSDDDTKANYDAITALLNKRAMVIKNAQEKTEKLPSLLRNLKEKDEYKYLLVYCDNKDQILEAQSILKDNGVYSSKITFEESAEERVARFNAFKTGSIDCLVARKCLDEGVNIPAARRAILIASNTDQREYIQRLGRILRTYENKDTGYVKDKATIYDFVVLPPLENAERFRYMIIGEGRRLRFFINHSINKEELTQQCSKILDLLTTEEQRYERD